MLTGVLPGYLKHEELLLTLSVELLSSCNGVEVGTGAAGAVPSQDDCQRRDEAMLGPLTGPGGMLSTPLLRLAQGSQQRGAAGDSTLTCHQSGIESPPLSCAGGGSCVATLASVGCMASSRGGSRAAERLG
jgi:hypothetical protein